MKSIAGTRAILIVITVNIIGLLTLVSCVLPCVGCPPPPTPTPTPTPPTPEATFGTPAPLPTPTATAEALGFEVEFQSVTTSDISTNSPDSAAFLFLRDRSESMKELCPDDTLHTASIDIPRFFYAYLEQDPALANTDIFMGLATFPNISIISENATPSDAETDDPTMRLLRDTQGNSWWINATEEAWSEPTDDGQGFMQAIESGIDALKTTEATTKHLVVIGDSMMAYNGASEWPAILGDDPGATDPLTKLLRDGDARLSYVLVDCRPRPGKLLVSEEIFRANLIKWEDVTGFESEATAPFDEDTFIKVFGRSEYLVDKDEPLSIEGTIQQLFHSLLADYLPSSPGHDLWQQQRTYLGIGEGAENFSIPIPGYAEAVNIHMISLDPTLRFTALERPTTDVTIQYPRFGFDTITAHSTGGLSSPLTDCEGWSLGLNQPTSSPTIIWWDIVSSSFDSISGTLLGDSDPAKPGIQVLSNTEIHGTIDNDLAGYDGPSDFQECFRIAVQAIPQSEEEPEQNPPAFVSMQSPAAFSIPYDVTSKDAEQFVMYLKIALYRLLDLGDDNALLQRDNHTVNSSSNSYSEGEIERLFEQLGSTPLDLLNDQSSPDVTFHFRPSVVAPIEPKPCPEGSQICEVPINLNFVTDEYYPDGLPTGTASVYLLAREQLSTDCATNDIYFKDLGDNNWRSQVITREGGRLKDRVDPIDEPPFDFEIAGSEIDKCKYEYVVILWKDVLDDWPVISCSIAEGRCFENQFKYINEGN